MVLGGINYTQSFDGVRKEEARSLRKFGKDGFEAETDLSASSKTGFRFYQNAKEVSAFAPPKK